MVFACGFYVGDGTDNRSIEVGFEPDFVIMLPGFDAHYLDPIAQLTTTTDTIKHVTRHIHRAAHEFADGRLAVASGGGYSPRAFAWGAGVVMSELTGHPYNSPVQTPPFVDDEDTWDIVRRNVKKVKELVFPFHSDTLR